MQPSRDQFTFLSSSNAAYIADLYARFLQNPKEVDASWVSFFKGLNDSSREVLQELAGASWGRGREDLHDSDMPAANVNKPAPVRSYGGGGGTADQASLRQATMDSVRALMLIRSYRIRGHLYCDLDPLRQQQPAYHPELDPKTYGFTDADMDRPIFINHVLGLETATLREILRVLRETYSGTIGVEYMHIQDPEQKAWIQERIEGARNHTDFTEKGKKAILQRITAAEGFERFLHMKYTGTKRFGLEGGEALVPAIEQIMKRGGQLGVRQIVLGMSHRGRLNILTNVMGKSFTAIFSEFQGNAAFPDEVQGSGDVKYHLGTSSDRDFDGNVIHLSLTANPSHLEAVDPVVVGKARAKQEQLNDESREQVLSLLLHGDAAFAGQGLVAETLMMSELKGYRIGGTIHIVINNQIGFTTMPQYSRSGPYPTDVAKMVQAPIFHVNGDDPESVVHVSRIAMEFRQQFKKDVVIDMFCYRRHGHNEGDEPSFTQPLMYKAIRTQKTTREIYAEKLTNEGTLNAEEAQQMVDDFQEYLEGQFKSAESYKPNNPDMFEGQWKGFSLASDGDRRGKTAISDELAQKVGKALTTVPPEFKINSKILRQLEAKKEMFKTGEGFDWSTAEALAYGTLAEEGYPVRLSGQDCGRGTFSQRHSVWFDQESEARHVPLNHISPKQAKYDVHDSPLSEAAVLGFEYGFTLSEPNTLVLWEAQFGDFVNGAQVIIDQFIATAELKWHRMSGLVMLLPHGYEGQGPEHSSARIERFLQLCGQDNWQVVNCTTPANYFHVLRRQIHREFRKPLIVFTPKSLLRHKLCVSPLSAMTGQESFHRVLFDDAKLVKDSEIRRVVLCSGKVYYDLFEEREKRGLKDVALLRIEQLYPWPENRLLEAFARYENADVVWCQEEPMNQGPWTFVDRRIEDVLKKSKNKTPRPRYVGRSELAAPATGLYKRHQTEQARLVNEALTI